VIGSSRLVAMLLLLRGVQGWSPETVAAYQLARLRRVLSHARRNVAFWRATFDRAGLRPEQITTLDDVRLLPITSRAEIQATALEDRLARGLRPQDLVAHTSSGSTGEPLTVLRAWAEERLLLAFRQRVWSALGAGLTDTRALVTWLEPALVHDRWFERLGLLRQTFVSCLLPADEIVRALRRSRPDVLCGYSATMAWMADSLSVADRAAIRPHLILTGGETLTPSMRCRLSDAFHAPVRDTYASNEFVLLAWECPHTGAYHLADTAVLTEVVREDGEPAGPGEIGELVGTALHSYAMPFIRYRLGDLVIRGASPCRCGAPWGTLERVVGRTIDRFVLPDGTSMHPYVLGDALMEAAPWLQRFKLIQERADLVVVTLRPHRHEQQGSREVATAFEAVQALLPAGVRVEVRLVSEIEAGPGGKVGQYISRVWREHESPECPAVERSSRSQREAGRTDDRRASQRAGQHPQ
jgi:phenylacetate-CoA ligase